MEFSILEACLTFLQIITELVFAKISFLKSFTLAISYLSKYPKSITIFQTV